MSEANQYADIGIEIESEDAALSKLGTVGGGARPRRRVRPGNLFGDPEAVRAIEAMEEEAAGIPREVQPAEKSKYWALKTDGSLRGKHPLEAVSIPLSRKKVPDALDEYADAAMKARYPYRTSTHIHLNLQQKDATRVAGLIPMSLLADNFFFAMDSEHRRGNYNCRPQSLLLQQIPTLAKMAAKLDKEKVNKQNPFQREEVFRYTATNWMALSKFGTLELRHFIGTRDKRTILKWVDAALEMRENLAIPLDRAQVIFEEMYYGGYVPAEEFLARYFPVHCRLMAYEGMDEDLARALERVDQFFNYFDMTKKPTSGLNYALTRKWRM